MPLSGASPPLSRGSTRRDILVGAAGVVAGLGYASPLRAQTAPTKLVGVIRSGMRDADSVAQVDAVRAGMRDLGWAEDQHVRYDVRWIGNDVAVGQAIVADLLKLRPDVIHTTGTVTLTAALAVTREVPIVFLNVTDPVAGGFVASLARPGGTVTGFTPFEYAIAGKWLDLLVELAPQLRRVALLGERENHNFQGFSRVFEPTARAIGIEPIIAPAHEAADVSAVIDTLRTGAPAGLIVSASGFSVIHRALIERLAAEAGLPAIYWNRNFPQSGGLMSYGPNFRDMNRQSATYISAILKGARPAEMPVQAAVRYELIVNTTVAGRLGLAVPPRLLAIVDDFVE